MFNKVRNWGKIRGLNESSFQAQYQKVLQEIVEIHEAYISDDFEEVQDAIGDSLVTIINLAKTQDYNAEDCLKKAFDVIELRKGLNFNGIFVRYKKLSFSDQEICDQKQGNPGSEYFSEETILSPKNFTK